MTQLSHSSYAMPAERGAVENLLLAVGVVRRGWRIILACVVLCATAGGLYAARARPVYKGIARLLLIQEGGRSAHAAVGSARDPFPLGDPNDDIPTHMLIIRSPMLLERAVEQAGLPQLTAAQLATALKVTRPEPAAKMLDIGYQAGSADEAVKVVDAVVDSYTKFLEDNYQKNTNDVVNLISQVRDELNKDLRELERKYVEFRKQHPTLAVSDDGRTLPARQVDLLNDEVNRVMLRSAHVQSRLELVSKLHDEGEGLRGISSVLRLLGDPAENEARPSESAGGDSALQVETQLEDLGVKRATAERLVEHLQAEQARLREERPVSEQQVSDAFYAEPETERLVAQLKSLTARRDNYRRTARGPGDAAVREAERRVDTVAKQLDALWTKRSGAIRAALERESTSEIDAEIRRAETELIVYRAQEAALRERRDQREQQPARDGGPGSARAASGRSGPAALLQTLRRGLEANERVGRDMKKRFEEALAKAQESEIDRLTEANMRAELERQRTMFLSVVDQLKQARVVGDHTNLTAQAVIPPSAEAVQPKVALVLAAALVLGLGLGFGLAFLYDAVDAQLRSLPEIRRTLDVAVLGLIPELSRRGLAAAGGVAMISHDEPRSLIAESYKSIRTNLEFLRRNRQVQTLLVTSPQPGDGKSTSASNLAITLAHAGRKVLLVDADLRRPVQHLLYGLDRDLGLAQVLKTLLPVSSVVQRTMVENLDLMSAGPAVANPSELLASAQFAEFLEVARAHYDMVIVDSSPLLAVTDPCIIGSVVDGIVLVVRATSLRRHDAERATELLRTLGTPVLGTIINGITRAQAGFGQAYGYGYGYGTVYGAASEPRVPQTLGAPPRGGSAGASNGATGVHDDVPA